ncbi:MAG TPA: DUF6448 family protein [Bryobacteraceae bacterium]|nr:hypothetical protein [Bryobacterales bacterium]HRJ17885.1 DUF6448 family protein [Bryobacteraceae bacterium]
MKSLIVRIVPLSLLLAGAALAHCDTIDGPVATSARQALERTDVRLVLHWVQPKDEVEVRRAFDEAIAVRSLNSQSRQLADRYFLETVVRVHRAGEGAAYTGLKPAGEGVDPGVVLADKTVESGNVAPLIEAFSRHMASDMRKRFDRMDAARKFAPGDVEAGRAFVEAYVDFIHYAESVHKAIASQGHAH